MAGPTGAPLRRTDSALGLPRLPRPAAAAEALQVQSPAWLPSPRLCPSGHLRAAALCPGSQGAAGRARTRSPCHASRSVAARTPSTPCTGTALAPPGLAGLRLCLHRTRLCLRRPSGPSYRRPVRPPYRPCPWPSPLPAERPPG
eukprot:2171471-Alexandrium_andersonii.AAC.1